jgi:hypothetical protein
MDGLSVNLAANSLWVVGTDFQGDGPHAVLSSVAPLIDIAKADIQNDLLSIFSGRVMDTLRLIDTFHAAGGLLHLEADFIHLLPYIET